MGLLERGRKWSDEKTREESEQVRYFRDGKEISTLYARVAPPSDVVSENAVVALATDDRDFLVNRTELIDYRGVRFLPKQGDWIEQRIFGESKIFRVAKRERENCFAFRDGGETSLRIHTRLWKEDE